MANENHIQNIVEELDAYEASKSYKVPVGECSKLINNTQRTISVLHLNIRSVTKNFDNFVAFLHTLKIDCDIIILTKGWLKKTTVIPILDGYNSHITKNTYVQSK